MAVRPSRSRWWLSRAGARACARVSLEDALVDELLLPELHALAAVDPAAAAERGALMAADAFAFCRGSLALHAAWMAREIGASAPWTWCVGDAHPGNLMVICSGPRDRDGNIPAAIDWADVDDEIACPWTWDAVRLGAAVAAARPDLDQGAHARFMGEALASYRGQLLRWQADDDRWQDPDPAAVPTTMQQALRAADDADTRKRWFTKQLIGSGDDARLERGDRTADDPAADRCFRAILDQEWQDAPRHRVLDVARRLRPAGVAARGRRRWLVLVRERGADEWHRRLVELKEHRASTVSRHLPVSAFAAIGPGTRTWTSPMAGDPFQRLLHAPGGDVLARTRCHAREPLGLAGLDDADLEAAARLVGGALGRFHLRGLAGLGQDVGSIAGCIADDARRASVTEWSWALAAACRAWHRRFVSTWSETDR